MSYNCSRTVHFSIYGRRNSYIQIFNTLLVAHMCVQSRYIASAFEARTTHASNSLHGLTAQLHAQKSLTDAAIQEIQQLKVCSSFTFSSSCTSCSVSMSMCLWWSERRRAGRRWSASWNRRSRCRRRCARRRTSCRCTCRPKSATSSSSSLCRCFALLHDVHILVACSLRVHSTPLYTTQQ